MCKIGQFNWTYNFDLFVDTLRTILIYLSRSSQPCCYIIYCIAFECNELKMAESLLNDFWTFTPGKGVIYQTVCMYTQMIWQVFDLSLWHKSKILCFSNKFCVWGFLVYVVVQV